MVKKARRPQFFTKVMPASEQATGSFDHGAITEQKMIGFAGEGSAIHRLGPLYYWAWAEAGRTASVEPHPHRGFEIISYVLKGRLEHRDSLGNISQISSGGLQLMQTGSGIEHEEHFIETPAESLQIWLDPHFRQEIGAPPRYSTFTANQFLREKGATCLLGEESPIQLVTPSVAMQDLTLAPDQTACGLIPAEMGWAAIVLQGQGTLGIENQSYPIQARDFIVHQAEHETNWRISTLHDLHLIWIRVPLLLPYALFPKPR